MQRNKTHAHARATGTKCKMLVGLPHVSKQKCMDLRICLNTLLEQHPHVASPLVCRWTWAHEAPAGSHAVALAGAFVRLAGEAIVRGPHFIIVRPSGEAALLTQSGAAFFIGTVDTLHKPFHGAVLVAALTRGPRDTFFGGTLHLLDVLAYDGVCLMGKPVEFRHQMVDLMPPAFQFPLRFRIRVADWNVIPAGAEMCAMLYLLPADG